MNDENKTICPECFGTGENQNRFDRLKTVHGNNFNLAPASLICEGCGGNGEIPADIFFNTGAIALYAARGDGSGRLIQIAKTGCDINFPRGLKPLDFLRIQAESLEPEGFDTKFVHFTDVESIHDVLADFYNIIQTSVHFWDCDCEENFIHRKSFNSLLEAEGMRDRCAVCGAKEEESADSRIDEIIRHYQEIITPEADPEEWKKAA